MELIVVPWSLLHSSVRMGRASCRKTLPAIRLHYVGRWSRQPATFWTSNSLSSMPVKYTGIIIISNPSLVVFVDYYYHFSTLFGGSRPRCGGEECGDKCFLCVILSMWLWIYVRIKSRRLRRRLLIIDHQIDCISCEFKHIVIK